MLLGLDAELVRETPVARACAARALEFLIAAQNTDGGWSGSRGGVSSVEETGVALAVVARARPESDGRAASQRAAVESAVRWLAAAVEQPPAPSPIGLYFSRLWYYEELYPLIFAVEGLAAAGRY